MDTDREGRILALGIPESLLVSTDHGHTFDALADAPHIGAMTVGKSADDELLIVGKAGRLRWEHAGSLTRTTDAAVDSTSDVVPGEAPQAAALKEFRGQITGDRYYEIRHPVAAMRDAVELDVVPKGAPPDWVPLDMTRYELARGPLGGALDKRDLDELAGCTDARLAAYGDIVAIACAHPLEKSEWKDAGVRLLRSEDRGGHFAPVTELVTPDFSKLSRHGRQRDRRRTRHERVSPHRRAPLDSG